MCLCRAHNNHAASYNIAVVTGAIAVSEFLEVGGRLSMFRICSAELLLLEL